MELAESVRQKAAPHHQIQIQISQELNASFTTHLWPRRSLPIKDGRVLEVADWGDEEFRGGIQAK